MRAVYRRAARKVSLMGKKRDQDTPPELSGVLPSTDLSSLPTREVTTPYLPSAPPVSKNKRIHPRRIAPAVPEAAETPDPDPPPR